MYLEYNKAKLTFFTILIAFVAWVFTELSKILSLTEWVIVLFFIFNVTGLIMLIKNNQTEKKLQKQRNTYIATLKHDLKVPTIAQMRALELLLSKNIGEINDDQEEVIKSTLDSCQYMYQMVSTLLNTYKYENGEIILNYDTFDLNQLTEECINDTLKSLKENNLTIIFKPNAQQNIINADKLQIQRVITNIINNAVSYAYKNSDLIINIKNYGKKLEINIENKSTQISNIEKFNKVGADIGLYLSRQIIEAHNGTIIAKRYRNNTCKFGFTIPTLKNNSNNQPYNHISINGI